MAKKDDIIAAATKLFLKHGFGGTSMETVACEAKVAKQTLYSYFSSKEELFCAIITGRCTSLFDDLPENTDNHDDVATYLVMLGERLMAMLFTTDTLELYRLVVAETPRFPELGRTYYEFGPKAGVDMLAAFLDSHGAKKEESNMLAEQFFGMLTGHLLSHALLDKKYRPSATERKNIAKKTSSFFLAALNIETCLQ